MSALSSGGCLLHGFLPGLSALSSGSVMPLDGPFPLTYVCSTSLGLAQSQRQVSSDDPKAFCTFLESSW